MDRVEAAANRYHARIYRGYPNPDGLPRGSDLDEARLSHNGIWLEQQKWRIDGW